jgi:hypothetical protein
MKLVDIPWDEEACGGVSTRSGQESRHGTGVKRHLERTEAGLLQESQQELRGQWFMPIRRSEFRILSVSDYHVEAVGSLLDELRLMPFVSFGVVRALLDANLLPRVIAGTSAGALVAALVCTRTDAELRRLLVPKLADKITACQDPFVKWGWRWLRTGARFSAVEWAKKVSVQGV